MTINKIRLLHDKLLENYHKQPEKTAVVAEGKSYTYGQWFEQASTLAADLRGRGMNSRDRVVIYMDNTWTAVVSIYAVLMAGGCFVVVNPQTKADKLEYIIKDCEARLMITDAHLAGNFKALLEKSAHDLFVICSGDFKRYQLDGVTGLIHIDEILKTQRFAPQADVVASDLAALIYTSGSTGNPKGVMQTHQSMLFAANSLSEYLRLQSDDVILNVLPLAFDYGLYQLLMTVQMGATIVLERSFVFPTVVFNNMIKHKVTVFPAVPTIYRMVIDMHKRSPLQFEHVRRITNTAAAMPAEYVPLLQEIFPNTLVYLMYGLTECKRVSYLEPELVQQKPNCVGKAIPGTEVFLLSEQGEPAAANEIGILHVRGPHIMAGYWRQPEKTAHMIKEGFYPGDKVLCTHDYFKMDEDGFLYFMGRKDDIIKSRGEKVSPAEVENAIYTLSGVLEVAVIGMPDEVLGQAVKAFVACDPAANIGVEDIKRVCNQRLENFMVPKEVVFMDELPKTNTGKISKKGLS